MTGKNCTLSFRFCYNFMNMWVTCPIGMAGWGRSEEGCNDGHYVQYYQTHPGNTLLSDPGNTFFPDPGKTFYQTQVTLSCLWYLVDCGVSCYNMKKGLTFWSDHKLSKVFSLYFLLSYINDFRVSAHDYGVWSTIGLQIFWIRALFLLWLSALDNILLDKHP